MYPSGDTGRDTGKSGGGVTGRSGQAEASWAQGLSPRRVLGASVTLEVGVGRRLSQDWRF